jgi:thiol-disulfide isomerase/thioredoxin
MTTVLKTPPGILIMTPPSVNTQPPSATYLLRRLFRSLLTGVRAFTLALLSILLSHTALADRKNFLEGLQQNGATPEELERFDARYQEAPAALRARFDSSSVADLAGYLEYQRNAWASEDAHPLLEIGSPMPEFALKGVDGNVYTPESVADAQLVVVAFITNHCPASQMYEERLKQLITDYRAQGVAFLAIQPDAPEATAPSELNFTDVEDDFAGMVIRAQHRKFDFPYLDDGENQSVVGQFGPKVTPHVFIFDQQRTLRYEGRIDNHLIASKATSFEARDAIEALLANEPVPVARTSVFGCSIKWRDKRQSADRERAEWQRQPVSLQSISLDELSALRLAPPGNTLTMINMWATWCGPCRIEMPELLKSYQWYRSRGVDLVTVALDAPENHANVLAFLEQVHAPVSNYLVDTDDFFAVQRAFDTAWQSGVPYTLVLDRYGTVIFRHEGELDILELRRTILAYLDEPGIFQGNAEYWRQ